MTFIYPVYDDPKTSLKGELQGKSPECVGLAESFGIEFVELDSARILPICIGKPTLLADGVDLLAEPQMFVVATVSWRTQADMRGIFNHKASKLID
ncbi:MAG: hypothetical protein ABJ370_07555 [Paracoccaceae bacterium]